MGETKHTEGGPLSTPAIISYLLLGEFGLSGAGIFVLIFTRVPVEPVLVGVLSGLLTALTAALAGVTGYWLASDAQAKKTSAAVAQLAGAGAPPPAQPLDPAGAGTPSA